ncbi:MAG: ATPase [Candidatus Kaiserbacteria bacterium]|nr:ATPase [Candidatus Kaiserbacteria bacterium]
MTQEEALTILKTGANVFLTGEPGAGKTYTINQYIKWLRERGIQPSVTASTGIAATHVNGMTIHSWSGIGIKRSLSEWDLDSIMTREKTVARVTSARVLIIDEISMLDATTLDMVDRVVRNVRSRQDPFGGLQVIFVGDFFQLPPISNEGGSIFAFESRSWAAANPLVCYLGEQHRQDDDDFLGVLGAIRRGEVEPLHEELLTGRMNQVPKKGTPTRLYTHNADVDRMNQESLAGIKGSHRTYEMKSQGSAALVESLKRSCLSPERLELKEGAAVMFTRNNFEAGYVNGTLGIVQAFSGDGTPIVRTFDGRIIQAEPAEWAMQDGNKVLARLTQVPLRLAWAITVHKSQGMSLDAAIMDLSRAFEYGQGYVAISRVRTLGGLYLTGLNRRALELHPAVIEKDSNLRDASDAARRKFNSIAPGEVKALHANFVRAAGGREPTPEDIRKAAMPAQMEPKKTGLALAKLREKYPNAGRPWNGEDDAVLRRMFADKADEKDIGKHFGRKPSAIRARLAHLGLIEEYWVIKKKKEVPEV